MAAAAGVTAAVVDSKEMPRGVSAEHKPKGHVPAAGGCTILEHDAHSEACDSEEETVVRGENILARSCAAVLPQTSPSDAETAQKLNDSLQELTNTVRLLSEKVPPQNTKWKQKKEWAHVMARVAQVKSDIDTRKIVLPDPGANAVWSILDSGSSIDAADFSKHFPGASLEKTEHFGATYETATGEPFHNMGQFDLEWKTENGHQKNTRFNNAKVSIPIQSMDRWNAKGHRTTLDDADHESYTVHKDTGEVDPVINRAGVYFLKMFVHKRLLKPPTGFVRPGEA